MVRNYRVARVIVAVLLSMAWTLTVRAQTSPPVMDLSINGTGRYLFSKISALAVSDVSDRFAIADENLNRVFVFQSDGRINFVVGESGWLVAPVALCFENDAALLVITSAQQVLRVTESSPDRCDTVADLRETISDRLPAKIAQVVRTKRGYLLRDNSQGQVIALDSAWAYKNILIKHGHGMAGKVWEPTDLEVGMGGKIIVSDRGDYPLQAFTSEGTPLFSADWSTPERRQTWEASAVAINQQELIWAADVAHQQWRLYDQTGTLLNSYAFQPAGMQPAMAAFTFDNRLIVVDERGTVSIWSVTN